MTQIPFLLGHRGRRLGDYCIADIVLYAFFQQQEIGGNKRYFDLISLHYKVPPTLAWGLMEQNET